MMKLAVIFESSPFDRKGLFNAVHNRVKHLSATGECTVDVFCVHSRDNAFTRRVRHTPVVPSVDEVSIDGITYRLLWYRFSVLDNVLLEKMNLRPLFFRRFMSSRVELLKGYDAVVAHSFCGGLFALMAHQRFNIPYYVTWHGSDVHTHPWRVPVMLEDTRAVMESARCNFFVSKALMTASDKITVQASKEVLYNGVSEDFVEFSPADRAAVRERFGLAPEDKVLAFVGNLAAVKNVLSLPAIFAEVVKRYDASLKFWIVGDGKLRTQLETACSESLVRHCEDRSPSRHCEERSDVAIRFFGNLPSTDMPAIMNCIDVLVLPSLNEGLPLVCAEALNCGAAVVGSDVGGIAEVIGQDYVVPLGDSFATGMADKIVSFLDGKTLSQTLPSEISWSLTAERELSFLKS
ncbi:MAG: glycosyltransferase [Bacteroidales bacterium]|nr:glycosyltransferase [Bacteroidales bacterium]